MRETWFPSRERAEGEGTSRSRELNRRAIRKCLPHVLRQHRLGAGQRRDCSRNGCDLRPAATGQGQALDRSRQQLVGGRRPRRSGFRQPDPRGNDASANRARAFAAAALELERPRARDRDDEIEPVEQRARELVPVVGEALRRASAFRAGITTRAARADVRQYFGPALRVDFGSVALALPRLM